MGRAAEAVMAQGEDDTHSKRSVPLPDRAFYKGFLAFSQHFLYDCVPRICNH